MSTESSTETPVSIAAEGTQQAAAESVETPLGTEGAKVEEAEITVPELTPAQIEKILSGVTRKVKVDGEEREVKLADLEKDYQLKEASYKKMSEAANVRKQMERLVGMAKDPVQLRNAIKELGVDEKEFATKILNEYIEDEMMDPKDKEVRELKRQLADRDAEVNRQKEEHSKKQQSDLEAKYTAELVPKFKDALKTSGLPETKYTWNQMITRAKEFLDIQAEAGIEDPQIDAADIAKQVREDYTNAFKSLFSLSDAETLANLVGEDGMKKIRNYDVNRLKNPIAASTKSNDVVEPKAKKGSDAKSFSQVMKEIKEGLR